MHDANSLQHTAAGGNPSRSWRAFGRAGDLDLDFHAQDRAGLITCLLAACWRDADGSRTTGRTTCDREADAWQLSLSGRIGGLAEILSRTQDVDEMPLHPRCSRCGEAFEISLSLAAIAAMGRDADSAPLVAVPLDGADPIMLRRPTGADQRRWQTHPLPFHDAEAAMLADLLVSGFEPHGKRDLIPLLPRVVEVMEEVDLLPAFRVSCTCPHCAHANDLPLDLEGLLLSRLEQQTQRLTLEVHRLASRYGWREAEILELPQHRRAAYLRLLDQEAGWP